MSCTPVTSEYLRSLNIIEGARRIKINYIVKYIYPHVLNAAKYTGGKTYSHEIHFADRVFYSTNMQEIVTGLKELFPDTSITYNILAPRDDVNLYDAIINRGIKANTNSYILLDWT